MSTEAVAVSTEAVAGLSLMSKEAVAGLCQLINSDSKLKRLVVCVCVCVCVCIVYVCVCVRACEYVL